MGEVNPVVVSNNQKREYNPQTDYVLLLTQPVTNVAAGQLPYTITSEFIVSIQADGTVLLPAAPLNGQLHRVRHNSAVSPSDQITVDGNGNNINGQAAVIIKTRYTTLQFQFNSADGEWMII